MLYAITCETPVLATLVGGITDIIKVGETGFIIENTAANVIRALISLEPETIAENG